MKRIELASLVAGNTAEYEYFSKDGKLLIARGILLTTRHLDTLKRNNVLDLFIKGTDAEHIAHEVLTTDYSKHHTALPPDNPFYPAQNDRPWHKPRALDMPEFKGILAGENGFKQLVESKKAVELDNFLREEARTDQPSGMPVKGGLRQIAAKDRSDEYKKKTTGTYNDLIVRTKTLLDSLTDGNHLDYVTARSIVEQLLKILTNDMSFLLNMTVQQYTEEDHVYNHSLKVSVYALCIAIVSGYNQRQVIEIGIGALLHDIGMLLVPRMIYLKKGKLDKDEWYEIMKHPVLGVHLLEKIDRLPESIPFMAYQCHERENGKGYPKQRGSRFIHNYARICAVADMYEALSSPRPYRDALIPYRALEMVIKASHQGLISGEYTKSLVQCLSLFPVGSIVELSNRCIGKVVKASQSSLTKPLVSLLYDENGKELSGGGSCEMDLMSSRDVSIVKAHPNDYKGVFWLSGF
jgi:HD-GYP domain-containing protein (c-di-GMP phosphodiesterase class II)